MSRRERPAGALLLLGGVLLGLVVLCAVGAAAARPSTAEPPLYGGEEPAERGGFSLAAASLNREVREALSLLANTTLSGREYRTLFGAPPEKIGAEQLRYYVRTGSYADGRWPVFSLDESCEVQFHYERISDTVLIYAQPRRERDAQNDNYQSPPYLFVPASEDFSSGEWYYAGDSDYQVQIDRVNRDTEEIYRRVRESWKRAAG